MTMDDVVAGETISNEAEEELEAPPTFALLRVMQEVLSNSVSQRHEQLSASFCVNIIQTYPGLEYADIPDFITRFYDKVDELRAILDAEIDTDPECFKYNEPAEDAEHNGVHYKNVLVQWQVAAVIWETEWEPLRADAAIEVAAMAEIHKMFFSPTGVLSMLDNIPFQFDEADRDALTEALREARDSAPRGA